MKSRRFTLMTKSSTSHTRSLRLRAYRQPRFETLENRQLLTVSLPTIADYTVPVLAPVPVELVGSDTDGDSLTYSVSSSDPSVVKPILTASTNPVVKMSVAGYGDMKFQLYKDLVPDAVGHFLDLVNNHTYDNKEIYRISPNFVIQGGLHNSAGTTTQFDDQFDPNLRFTRRGVLAMANRGSDTNTSEFFITDVAGSRFLDHRYTIIGFMTEGESVRAALQAASGARDNMGVLTTPITLTSVSVVPNAQSAVLLLSALKASPQAVNVTVTVSDGKEAPVSRTFKITAAADTDTSKNDPPYIPKMDAIKTTVNTAVSFNIPSADVDRTTDTVAPVYTAKLVSTSANGTVTEITNPLLSISVDSATGRVTATPSGGLTGVFGVKIGVVESLTDGSARAEDTQVVPLYINPVAPTGVVLLPTAGGSRTNLDNSTSTKKLTFRVSGITSLTPVIVYADGKQIGTATQMDVTATTVDVTTDGATALDEGPHVITAKQLLEQQNVAIGNFTASTVGLYSQASPDLGITVALEPPQFNAHTSSFSVLAEDTFTTVISATDDGLAKDSLQASFAGNVPAGATLEKIAPATFRVTWHTQELDGNQTFTIPLRVTDLAGQTADTSLTVDVAALDRAPVFTLAQGPGVVVRGATLHGQVQAVDPDRVDAHAIRYRLSDAPDGATIDPVSGVIDWSVPADFPTGAVQFTVVATEQSAVQRSAVIVGSVTIVAPNAPVAIVTSSVTAASTTLPLAATTTTTAVLPQAPVNLPENVTTTGGLFGNSLFQESYEFISLSGGLPVVPRKELREPGEEPSQGKPGEQTRLDSLQADAAIARWEEGSADDASAEVAVISDAAFAALAEDA